MANLPDRNQMNYIAEDLLKNKQSKKLIVP